MKNFFSDIKLEKTNGIEIILFLSCVLYFQQSWVPGFFLDGYLYSVLGKNAAELGHWLVPFQSETQYSSFDQHPPLLFILEGLFFKVTGFSYTAARIFSGLWSFSTVLGLFYFLSKLKNKRWAFFSALILILTPSLMKKTRFPNLDLPLMLFFLGSLGSYYLAEFKSNKKYWYASGLFFGLALLIKGFPALVIPGIIFIHLLVTKRIKSLAGIDPWISLLFGFLLFGIWPLALHLSGNYKVFESYIHIQLFRTMVDGRDKVDPQYLMYFVHLFKTCLPWLVLSFLGGKLALKREDRDLFLLFLTWFLLVLIPFSLIKFKYSHYIIPLYPALAAMGGYYLSQIAETVQDKIYGVLKIIVPVTALVLLIFPITTKTRRHLEVYKTLEVLKLYNHKPKIWIVVDGTIEYYSTASLGSLEYGASPSQLSGDEFKGKVNSNNLLKDDLLAFVSNSFYSENEAWLKEQGLSILLELSKKNTVVLTKNLKKNLRY